MNQLQLRSRIVAVLALTVLAAALAIRIVGDSGAHASRASSTTPDPRLVEHFSVLRAAPGAAPPSDAHSIDAASRRFNLDGSLARQVSDAHGREAWLLPGADVLCLLAKNQDGVGVACSPVDEALAGRLAIIARSTTGGEDRVVGAVPDEVRAVTVHDRDGTVDVRPASNGYTASAAHIHRVVVATATGTETITVE